MKFVFGLVKGVVPQLPGAVCFMRKKKRKLSCLCFILLPLQLLQHRLELLLLLLSLLDGRLVLLVISHGDHSQDQVDQVKGAQEDHQYKEYHVGLAGCTQSLTGKKQ